MSQTKSRVAQPRVHRRAQARAISRAIDRYPGRHLRNPIAWMSRDDDGIADLALSFPAVLAAIARRDMGREKTEQAVTLVRHGAPLKAVAATLGVPMWLKKLPPEAFANQIPALPDGPLFTRQIANFLPKSPKTSAMWLSIVANAYAGCDEHFAVWAARECLRNPKSTGWISDEVEALAVFAWFSMRPELEATSAMPRRWTPAISFSDACDEMSGWRNRLLFKLYPEINQAARPAASLEFEGMRFNRLDHAEAFIAAGEALDNCLTDYGDDRGVDKEVWQVSEGDLIIAAMELETDKNPGGIPKLKQLFAGRNSRPTPQIIIAAYRFLLEWPNLQMQFGEPPLIAKQPDVQAYQRLFKPYWLAKGRARHLPLDLNPSWPIGMFS